MTYFIGIDLHKTQFTVHVRTEKKSEELEEIQQYPTTDEGYSDFLNRIEKMTLFGSNKSFPNHMTIQSAKI